MQGSIQDIKLGGQSKLFWNVGGNLVNTNVREDHYKCAKHTLKCKA